MEKNLANLSIYNQKRNTFFYLAAILIIICFQLVFTFNSMSQIRYEELAESVRNVFWLENKTIYDGVSSNVGWYGTLLLLYHTFGFSLYLAKFYRLLLFIISIVCLALILKKYLGVAKSIPAVLAIGLSPTLLFFNTLQTSYGLDVQYLLITIFLLSLLNFKKQVSAIFLQLGLGMLTMIALMSYPTFLFYLPSLGIYYIYLLAKSVDNTKKVVFFSKNLLISLTAFVMPLLIALIYVKDRSLLLYDPIADSGIFRGAGTFKLNFDLFSQNVSHLLSDLFITPNSYYFDTGSTDFSQFYPIIGVFILLVLGVWLMFREKKYRFFLGLIWLVFFSTLIFANLALDPSTRPGIRRNSGLLISIYGLYVFALFYITQGKWRKSTSKLVIIGLLMLIPVHHLLSYLNDLSQLSYPSIYSYGYIFTVLERPDKSLQIYIDQASKENLKLACKDEVGNLVTCRYSESYAAVAGACKWNKLSCQPVLGYDSKTKQYIPLSISLWENYYWPH